MYRVMLTEPQYFYMYWDLTHRSTDDSPRLFSSSIDSKRSLMLTRRFFSSRKAAVAAALYIAFPI
jgi:hypothetical protein